MTIASTYSDQCMPWTWYLANDMQFFVAAILIIYLVYVRSKPATVVLLVMLIASAFVANFYLSYENNLTIVNPDAQVCSCCISYSLFACVSPPRL